MNLTITEHLLVGENILVITVTKIKIALIFQGTRLANLGSTASFPCLVQAPLSQHKTKILDGKKRVGRFLPVTESNLGKRSDLLSL